jgi:hypothetical protein
MNGLDRQKYFGSIFFVFALGALLHLAIYQIRWASIHSLSGLWVALSSLTLNVSGLSKIWEFAASGGFLAAGYRWLFDNCLWKSRFLQGWFVRFSYLEGTWVGVLTPRTRAMRLVPRELTLSSVEEHDEPSPPLESEIPEWARQKGVVPIHMTIKHGFDRLILTVIHPDSTNTNLAAQLVYVEQSDRTLLYLAYHNEPNNRDAPNAFPHNGCCELKLINQERTKLATSEWRLKGTYWTDKCRNKKTPEDRGTWGDFHVRWESRKLGEKEIKFTQERFDIEEKLSAQRTGR